MPVTVSAAFNRFSFDVVDLPTDVTRSARSRRDYLTDNLTRLAKSDPSFSFLKGTFVPFGSLARRTKIQPLDDIDLLIILSDRGVRGSVTRTTPIMHRVKVQESKSPLALFADDAGHVNSVLVLNRMKKALGGLHHYKLAAVKRNRQALTLSLASHVWVFDLVPAVPIKSPQGKIKHFLIPDGAGQWMRTDPRQDATVLTKTNAHHGQRLLPVVRLLKMWNRRTSKPRLPSFLFEVLVLRVFDKSSTVEYAPQAVAKFFAECPAFLNAGCPSPTGFGTPLDDGVSKEAKQKVIAAMHAAENLAREALQYEQKAEYAKAIACWRKVFGERFPTYG